ncbi:MAG: hypothetical protein A2172_02655 [Candidatus Woykebacteria bacterium RBG_13_40_15]|uniref:Peptidase M16 n=1 Tax=Candidatus Woykebacteria bacterium RBG_13_40_15 TaxID=1802593 RepID=A0A1G1W6F9_9BACT|nr:MAG: hypothetical protein A2172_02655 [Candidatus Woykebacteria bacterium RBG_13_40_15]
MNPEITKLKNNLQVLVTKLPNVASATTLFLVRAGSRYEQKKQNGIAHFAEHMFFKGTKKRPTALDISSTVDSVGAEFNAFTAKEFTGFYIKAASKHLPLSFDVLTDMILHSKFDQREIDRERGVISEELRMNLDTPARYISDFFEILLYGDHPLGWHITGTIDSLKNINREDFISYLEQFYQPRNMVVSVSGGVGNEILKIPDQYLSDLSDKDVKNFLPVKEEQKKPAIKLMNKKTEQAHFCLGVRAYPRGHENRYKLAVLNTILGVSMSSRLFIQLRERRGLAYYVRSTVEEYTDSGFFVTQVGTEPKNIQEATKVILEEFNKLSAKNVLEDELKKAKEYIKGKIVLELEDSREVASMFGLQQLLENKIRTPEEIMENVERVSADNVKSTASDIFRDSKLNLAIIGPYKEEGEFVKILKLS